MKYSQTSTSGTAGETEKWFHWQKLHVSDLEHMSSDSVRAVHGVGLSERITAMPATALYCRKWVFQRES